MNLKTDCSQPAQTIGSNHRAFFYGYAFGCRALYAWGMMLTLFLRGNLSASAPIELLESTPRKLYEQDRLVNVSLLNTGSRLEELTFDLTLVSGEVKEGVDIAIPSKTIVFPVGWGTQVLPLQVLRNPARTGKREFTLLLTAKAPNTLVDPSPLRFILMDEETIGSPGALFAESNDPFLDFPSIPVNQLRFQSDGKILIAPQFYTGLPIIRLLANGSRDPSFMTNVIVPKGRFWLDAKDRIYTLAPPSVSGGVVRLLPDGIPDDTFKPAVDGEVLDLATFPDGRIVLAGYFTHVNGQVLNGLALLTESGEPIPSFHLDTRFSPTPQKVAVLGDGSFLMQYTGYLMFGSIDTIAIKPTGDLDFTRCMMSSVPVADFLDSKDGGKIHKEFRLLPDGAVVRLDPLIPSHNPFNLEQFSVLAEFADGRLFTSTALRTYSSGAPDLTFEMDIDGDIITALVLPDQSLLVGGTFEHVNGVHRVGLAHIATALVTTNSVVRWSTDKVYHGERGSAALTLIREGSLLSQVRVHVRSSSGSASDTSDFQAVDSILEFSPGAQQKDILIPIHEDLEPEADETFQVDIIDVKDGATILGDPSAQVVILDDDPTIGFTVSTNSIVETANVASISAIRTNANAYPLSGRWAQIGGSARLNVDLQTNEGPFVFPSMASSVLFQFPIIDTPTHDGTRTAIFGFEQFPDSTKVLVDRATFTLTLLDNELGEFPVDAFNGFVQGISYNEEYGLACMGNFTMVNGVWQTNVTRLDQNGRVQPEFSVESGFTPYTTGIGVRGPFAYVSSSWPTSDGTGRNSGIVTLDKKGTVTAKTSPSLPYQANSVFPAPDGSLYAAGFASDFNGLYPLGFIDTLHYYGRGALVRFLPDGSKDTNFVNTVEFGSPRQMFFDASRQEFWMAGTFTVYPQAVQPRSQSRSYPILPRDPVPLADSVACFRWDGSLVKERVLQFPTPFPTIGGMCKVGKRLVVAGISTRVNGFDRNGLFQMDWDGNVDPNWNPPLNSIANFGGFVHAVESHKDEAVVALVYMGNRRAGLVRVLKDGSLDTNFGVHHVSYASSLAANLIATTPDGTIFIAGSITSVDGKPRSGLARFYADGTLASADALELHLRPSEQNDSLPSLWIDSRFDGSLILESSTSLDMWAPEIEIPIKAGLSEIPIEFLHGELPISFRRARLR